MFDDLYSKAPYPINYFLEDLSNYILINFDNGFNIIGFNEKFLEKINLNKTKVKKYKFNEIFKGKNGKLEFSKLNEIEVYKRFECNLSDELTRKQTYTDFTCYLFNLGEDGFYFLARENKLGHGEIINEISKLNNELENTTRELNKKNLKLEFQNYFHKTLAEISSDLLEINPANIERKLNRALNKIGRFFNVDRSYIFQFNKDKFSFSNTYEWCRDGIASQTKRLQNIKADCFPWAMNKLQNNMIINIKDVKNMSKNRLAEQNLLEDLNLKSIIIMPMFVESELFGFFGFDSVRNKKEFSQEKISIIKIFTDLITRAFSKHIYDKRIRRLTYKDRLTSLYNRRFFEEELERLDTIRQLPISIIIADINGLKIINDSLGHEKGDQLLKKSGEILAAATRKEDIVARQGGDEFAILLPKTEKVKAEKVIARIKEKSRQTNDDELTVTMALGAAVKTDSDQNINDILRTADNTMYQNKLSESRSAKNRIIKSLLNNL
jgi:diguanylate cyclase (GGDEF)-like protein